GLVLPVVMQGISLVLRAAEDAGKRAEAATLAETKLAELVLLGDEVRESSGDFGREWPAYTWLRAEEAADDSMTQVTVTVRWETRGQPRELALSTWRGPEFITTTETETTGEATP